MSEPFWNQGLQFGCLRCSSCCRHDPGFVFLSAFDLRRLLDHTGLAFYEFLSTFVRKVDSGSGFWLSLREKANYDCILWGEGGCSVYASRPVQCSTFPFWKGILDSKEAWLDEAKNCPGIDAGAVVPGLEIKDRLWLQRVHPRLEVAYDVVLESIDENTLLGSTRIIADATDTGKIAEQDIVDNPKDNAR